MIVLVVIAANFAGCYCSEDYQALQLFPLKYNNSIEEQMFFQRRSNDGI